MAEYLSVSYDGEANITAEATDKFREAERETGAAGCDGGHQTQSIQLSLVSEKMKDGIGWE